MLMTFIETLKYEILLLLRNKGGWVPVLLLYSLTIALFAFSLSKNQALLLAAGPAIIWVAVLFSMLTLSELTLRKDVDEGWLSQLKLSGQPLWLFILAKGLAFWLILSSGFLLLLPVVAFWLYLKFSILIGIGFIYLITLPSLILLMLLGVSLTVGLPQPGLLLGLLLLPLYVPILILGQSAVATFQYGQWPGFEVGFLGAISMMSILFLPLLTDLTLQQARES